LRVRHLGEAARVEVEPDWIPHLTERWDEVAGHLESLGFARVQLDPRGYRRGSLLDTARAEPG
jgi:uncharacterized protein